MQFAGLPEILRVTINYIAKLDNTQPTGFFSKHGQSEVWGDIMELCAQTLSTGYEWFNFTNCMYLNYDNVPTNAQQCASSSGLDYEKILSCTGNMNNNNVSPVGRKYMIESINKTNSLGWTPPLPGSPTIYVNGTCIWGYPPCNALEGDEVRALVCQLYPGPKPIGCSQTPLEGTPKGRKWHE
jgi:hypothetical protein